MTTFTSIPQSIRQGDSLNLQLSYNDYPSTAYTGSFYLRGPSVMRVVGVSTGSGDYSFVLTPQSSSLLQSGTYEFAVAVSSSVERYTVDAGFIRITGDLAGAPSRIHEVEVMLTAVNDALLGRLTDGVINLSIAGRSLSLLSPKELLEYRNILSRELAQLTGNKSGVTALRVRIGTY